MKLKQTVSYSRSSRGHGSAQASNFLYICISMESIGACSIVQ